MHCLALIIVISAILSLKNFVKLQNLDCSTLQNIFCCSFDDFRRLLSECKFLNEHEIHLLSFKLLFHIHIAYNIHWNICSHFTTIKSCAFNYYTKEENEGKKHAKFSNFAVCAVSSPVSNVKCECV